MKALCIEGRGTVKLAQVDSPTPGPRQLLVRVHASALNRADLLQTLGLYPAPPGVPQDIPGLEYAGVVEGVGPGVGRFAPGDRVMGLVAGGAWAELLTVHEGEAMAVPPGLDLLQAAAVPEAFVTAWDALFLQAGLRAGQWALVHAVASGVGTAAIQLLGFARAHAVGTSRSAAKLERSAKVAPFVAVQTRAGEDFSGAVRAATGGRGVDAVLDLVGGDLLPHTLECAAEGGTVMLVGLTAGPSVDALPLRTLLSRRLTLKGTTLRARPSGEKASLAQAFEREVLPAFAEGKLSPVVSKVVEAAEANLALAAMMRNETFGKVVLTLGGKG